MHKKIKVCRKAGNNKINFVTFVICDSIARLHKDVSMKALKFLKFYFSRKFTVKLQVFRVRVRLY